jgi:hypothetical protein
MNGLYEEPIITGNNGLKVAKKMPSLVVLIIKQKQLLVK